MALGRLTAQLYRSIRPEGRGPPRHAAAHPSEAPTPTVNPLATNPQPVTAGTKLCLVNLDVRSTPPAFYKGVSRSSLASSSAAAAQASIQEHPNEREHSTDARRSSDGRPPSSNAPLSSPTLTAAPAFGEGNTLLNQANAKDAGKRRKPKNNITKSNSSFISRVIVNESLSKRLQDRPSDGLFAFANVNRAFQWLDMSSDKKVECSCFWVTRLFADRASQADYLTKVLFTKAHCLCHDVNAVTKSPSHVDVIMGFSTGEIIWWEPMSSGTQDSTRMQVFLGPKRRASTLTREQGIINKTTVLDIKWIPGSENLFMAAHMDGCLVVYDKEKETPSLRPRKARRNRRRRKLTMPVRLQTTPKFPSRSTGLLGSEFLNPYIPRTRSPTRWPSGSCPTRASTPLHSPPTTGTWRSFARTARSGSSITSKKSRSPAQACRQTCG